MFVKPVWCKPQTVMDGEDAKIISSAPLERVLLYRLERSSRKNVLHAMIGHRQAESLDGWRRIGPACDKPLLRWRCTQGRARATRGMQKLNSTSCSRSTSQVANGARFNRDRTRMTCSVRNCRAVFDAGGAHTVLTNNSLNQTRPRF
jgi:hypothetical protein